MKLIMENWRKFTDNVVTEYEKFGKAQHSKLKDKNYDDVGGFGKKGKSSATVGGLAPKLNMLDAHLAKIDKLADLRYDNYEKRMGLIDKLTAAGEPNPKRHPEVLAVKAKDKPLQVEWRQALHDLAGVIVKHFEQAIKTDPSAGLGQWAKTYTDALATLARRRDHAEKMAANAAATKKTIDDLFNTKVKELDDLPLDPAARKGAENALRMAITSMLTGKTHL